MELARQPDRLAAVALAMRGVLVRKVTPQAVDIAIGRTAYREPYDIRLDRPAGFEHLARLFRRENLPRLFGSDWFTKRTLRFAWHLTSVAWLGFAALLAMLADAAPPSRQALLAVVAATFLLTSLIAAVASRGRHLSWPVFLAVAVLAWLAR